LSNRIFAWSNLVRDIEPQPGYGLVESRSDDLNYAHTMRH
jgi:hypothetical protein